MSLNDFIKSVGKLGTLSEKAAAKKPPTDPKESFCKKALEQIAFIEKGITVAPEKSSLWYKAQDDGSFLVYLKNGIRYLPLQGASNEFHAKDAKAAIAYLNKAAEHADAGSFDELFAKTKPAGGGKRKTESKLDKIKAAMSAVSTGSAGG